MNRYDLEELTRALRTLGFFLGIRREVVESVIQVAEEDFRRSTLAQDARTDTPRASVPMEN